MYKFAHMADLHLGANRHPILEALELEKYNEAIDKCIEEKVDFVIISGDIFHIGIPDLSVVKYCFKKLKELYDLNIPVYVIFGSHDHNPNSDSIVNILEVTGLINNVANPIDAGKGKIGLDFVIDKKTGAKIVGLNARRGGIEREYFERLDLKTLEKEKGFKIFCFHAGLSEFKPGHMAAMETIPISNLPKGFDYYAGGHIHQRAEESIKGYEKIVYPGPIFSGYSRDLEQTARGENRGFFIVEFDDKIRQTKFVKLFESKSLIYKEYDVTGHNSNKANSKLEKEISKLSVEDKIVILKIKGELAGGKTSDIRTWNYKNILTGNGAIYVDINKHGITSKEFEAVKVAGEDVPAIESKLLLENIGAVNVSIGDLKGDKGAKLAEQLLKTLRVDIMDEENKTDYASRILDQAIIDLKLKEVFS